jgi:hypothetical protein
MALAWGINFNLEGEGDNCIFPLIFGDKGMNILLKLISAFDYRINFYRLKAGFNLLFIPSIVV